MSKMRMPEMSVVRFTESDVIVASAVPVGATINVYNFGDKNYNDGGIDANDVTVFSNSQTEPINRLASAFPGYDSYSLTFWFGEKSRASLYDMIADDSADGVSVDAGVNGLYTYQGNGTFYHQNQ